jgi:arylsulfatase A-like enzyme
MIGRRNRRPSPPCAAKCFTIGSSLVLLVLGALCSPAQAPRPNIVFILADDLGYGDVGCYGQRQIQTPHIDTLAKQGLRFTQAYAGATVCAPSRCGLMTGYHGGHARVRGNKDVPLRPDDLTVAEVLKSAGYHTALVGKWGLGNANSAGVPNKQGFDTFYGYLNQTHAHNFYPEFLWRDEEKVALRNKLPEGFKTKVGEGVSQVKEQYSHDLFTEEALQYLRSRSQPKDQPFFLYLAFTLPHANNEGKQQGMEVPSDAPYSDKDWPQQEKNRAAMVTRLDDGVGKVLATLKELGLEENTLVIFASDNGPHNEGGSKAAYFHSSGPFKGVKRDLYEGGIRVPFIARWPGHVRPDTTSDFVIAFWDFLPTAAELAGAIDKLPKDLDGQSIVPTLLGKTQNPHELLYFEFHERGFDQAVRFGDWKAIRIGFGKPLELYDLKSDPGETRNAAAEHPDLVQSAEQYLAGSRTDNPDFPINKQPRRQQERQSGGLDQLLSYEPLELPEFRSDRRADEFRRQLELELQKPPRPFRSERIYLPPWRHPPGDLIDDRNHPFDDK